MPWIGDTMSQHYRDIVSSSILIGISYRPGSFIPGGGELISVTPAGPGYLDQGSTLIEEAVDMSLATSSVRIHVQYILVYNARSEWIC